MTETAKHAWHIDAVSDVEECEAEPYMGSFAVTVFFYTEAEAQAFSAAMVTTQSDAKTSD